MASHGHSHGNHGHSHGDHGHSHGDHGHSHGNRGGNHGHSHGGVPCKGHHGTDHGHSHGQPQGGHGHSHGGVPCHGHGNDHGHSHGQPQGGHGHSHGGVPCNGDHGQSHGHGGQQGFRPIAGFLADRMESATKIPFSYSHYLRLIKFWTTEMTEKQREDVLNITAEDFALYCGGTLGFPLEPFDRFTQQVQMMFSQSTVHPLREHCAKIFSAVFTKPLPKAEMDEDNDPNDLLANFLIARAPDMQPVVFTSPAEVHLPVNADVLEKGGILPKVPDWLQTLSEKQDAVFEKMPDMSRPFVHPLEQAFVVMKGQMCLKIVFGVYSSFMFRLDKAFLDAKGYSPFAAGIEKKLAELDPKVSSVWKAYIKGRKNIRSAPEDAPAETEDAVAELSKELSALSVKASKTLVPRTPAEVTASLPPKNWKALPADQQFKGTPFAQFADLLMGRTSPPTWKFIEEQIQEFLQQREEQKRMSEMRRIQKAHESKTKDVPVPRVIDGVCGRKGCEKSNGNLMKCSRCGTNYCSKECQIEDWKKNNHRKTCALIQEAKKSEAENQSS